MRKHEDSTDGRRPTRIGLSHYTDYGTYFVLGESNCLERVFTLFYISASEHMWSLLELSDWYPALSLSRKHATKRWYPHDAPLKQKEWREVQTDTPHEFAWLVGFWETLQAPIKLCDQQTSLWASHIATDTERLSRFVTSDGSSVEPETSTAILPIVFNRRFPVSLSNFMADFTNALEVEHAGAFQSFDR